MPFRSIPVVLAPLLVSSICNEEPVPDSSMVLIPSRSQTAGKTRGFTLIELLVVIAIIGILLAILIPSLRIVKRRARQVICQSNLAQWGKLFSTYLTDNDDTFMDGWFGNPNAREGQWMYALRGYTGFSHDIWCCPEAGNESLCPIDRNGNVQGDFTSKTPWGHIVHLQHAGYATKEGDYGSYGINSFVYNVPESIGPSRKIYWAKSTTVNKPLSSVPVFMDDMWCESWPQPTDGPPPVEGTWGGYGMHSVCIDRHSEGYINILFMDWTVQKVGLKKLWYLNWHRDWPRNMAEPRWPAWMKNM
jgi:prepilin-type N-terminal cleavage/methylation domain-containing protein